MSYKLTQNIMFEEIQRRQELQKANILRGFGINPESEDLELEIFKAQETDIEKAKTPGR